MDPVKIQGPGLDFIPTQDTKPSLAFVSKWVYKFCPSQKLVHYQDIPFFKHPIGGGQLPKNVCKIL